MSDDTLEQTTQSPTPAPEEAVPTTTPEETPHLPSDKADAPELTGMYQNWFLDYASYVILERAVPHLGDGLKPVQRRILHTMKRMDDGRLHKVANIAGETMKFHPHGDASIIDALTQMGRQDLLIDCQGSWGNIITGDEAAAARYIEGRLTKFALDVLFNPKTTEWKMSYDGRDKEPVCLPAKYPLLLAQGAEGIAVGLSSKILPHNFGEICQAAISYLRGEAFQLYPDFLTGGMMDVSKYNDGMRGGSIKVRAHIEKRDAKTLAITDLPYGKTVGAVEASIVAASEKGKIKIRKVEDYTADHVEVVVRLAPGASSDKTIDALYAFTDCEISISPNCCVIDEHRPKFITVSDVLRRSVDSTRDLLRRELEIRLGELRESLMFASLERIFIEERIYKDKPFEEAKSIEAALSHIAKRLAPFVAGLVRDITHEDLQRLLEIKMARILRFNKDKADDLIARITAEMEAVEHDLQHITEVAINWFQFIYDKYAADHPRRTEIRTFDTIEATKVIEANEKLYINREEGFIGTSLKKDEFVENCSPIDDVILFYRDGTYKVVRIADKVFVGETERSKAEKKKAEIIHIAVYKRGDKRTIYNAVYREGKDGACYIKRFNVTGIIRDRENDLTTGVAGSRVLYFTANRNGEAEVVKVTLKPNPKLRRLAFDKDFGDISVKGRGSRGNMLTKLDVHKITLKAHGGSTLGGRKVWFDPDVQRLNFDERGQYLGEFHSDDRVLVILQSGEYYTTTFDPNNHYEATGLLRVEKMDEHKVWTAVLHDADQDGNVYLKRFALEASTLGKRSNLLGENPASTLLLLTDTPYPRLRLTYGGNDSVRPPLEVEAEDFVGVKSVKAKGKRLTTLQAERIEELEPTRQPEPAPEAAAEETPADDKENPAAAGGVIIDGQQTFF